MKKKILAICGSTRKDSTNEAILKGIAVNYGEQLDVELFTGLAELPQFNPDIDDIHRSEKVIDLLSLIENADGVIICTPEYVFSLPGALKNAIEWTVSTTVFLNKPTAFIIASGMGEKAFESLSLIMTTVGSVIGEGSAILIKGARSKFDETGQARDESTRIILEKMMTSFIKTLNSSSL